MVDTAKTIRGNVFAWIAGAIVMGVALFELAIADRKYGLFSGGFGQSSAVDAPGEIALFAAGYALGVAAAALLGWKLAVWLARGERIGPAIVHFAFLFAGITLVVLNLRYELHSYFSDAVGFAFFKQLGGGSAYEALAYARSELLWATLGVAIYAAAYALALRLVRRHVSATARAAQPRWPAVVIVVLAFLAALTAVSRAGGDAAKGLNRTLYWNATLNTAALATDFDADGYGLVGNPPDTAAFDAQRHPLALDIPGNGIDEDGFGGDLALVEIPQAPPHTPLVGDRPHLVLVVMESARADTIGKRIGGKVVAPNLERLAASGTAIAPVFSHVGFTASSMKSMTTGLLDISQPAPSLFRDLKASGYGVSIFSGQAEDFGDMASIIGMHETADTFIDSQALKEHRVFSYASKSSLKVDENTVLDAFDQQLGQAQNWQDPQFVYLNFQAAHFPYFHPSMSTRITDSPLERSEINAGNRERLALTYWNAVAHADAALGRLVDRLEQLGVLDDTLLIVTGDHGEALFENGFLGHGHRINALQYATFMVSNRRLDHVSSPLSLRDYRHIILDRLGADLPPRLTAPPFMHIGKLERPTAIGMMHPDLGVISLRLDTGDACRTAPRRCRDYASLEGAERTAFDALVARWGSERWAARLRERRGAAASSQRLR